MKITFSVLIFWFSIIGIILLIAFGIGASYEWNKNYLTDWNLADKASTISQKSEYIDKFVAKLDTNELKGKNARAFFPTENSSFDENLKALKSLQSRLHEIKDMDQNSFAYQTAIQQITDQEQGQAEEMISNLKSSWMRVNHYFFWSPWVLLVWLLCILGFLIPVFVFLSDDDYS